MLAQGEIIFPTKYDNKILTNDWRNSINASAISDVEIEFIRELHPRMTHGCSLAFHVRLACITNKLSIQCCIIAFWLLFVILYLSAFRKWRKSKRDDKIYRKLVCYKYMVLQSVTYCMVFFILMITLWHDSKCSTNFLNNNALKVSCHRITVQIGTYSVLISI